MEELIMNIISTTNVSRPGNDVYIEESYSLVEQFGVYAVIRFYRVNGWASREEVEVLITTRNQTEAAKLYKEKCKEYKR
jgi:hypothetical protein